MVFGRASPREGSFAHWHPRRHRGASWRHRSESQSIPVIPIFTEFRPIPCRLGPVHSDTIGASSGALSSIRCWHEGRGPSDCTIPSASFIPHHTHIILIRTRKESEKASHCHPPTIITEPRSGVSLVFAMIDVSTSLGHHLVPLLIEIRYIRPDHIGGSRMVGTALRTATSGDGSHRRVSYSGDDQAFV